MTEDNVREKITQALDGANQQLQGNPYLAEKIMAGENRGQRGSFRKRLIPLISVAMMLIVVTAAALLSRQTSVGGYGFWRYEEGQLLYRGENDKDFRVVMEDDQILAMDAEPEMNLLYYVTREDGEMRLRSVDPDGSGYHTPTRTINRKYRVQAIKSCDGAVYMLADTLAGNGQLYLLAGYDDEGFSEDQAIEGENWPNRGVTDFAADRNSIYAYCADTGRLAVFSAYDRKLKYDPVTVLGITCLEAGYQENGIDYVFALSDQSPAKVLLINTATGEKMDTGETVSLAEGRLDRDRYTLYAISDSDNRMTRFQVRDLSGKKALHELTIVNGDMLERAYLEAAIRMFNEQYPDTEVRLRFVEDDRVTATELMAGEAGIDLFMYRQSAETIPGELLFRNGAIRDLSAIPEIQAVLPVYQDVWHPVSAGGAIYGLPINRYIYQWQVNRKLAEEIGWKIPQGPWTIEAFEELVDQVIAWNKTHDEQVKLLCGNTEYLLSQYESTHIDIFSGTVNLETDAYIHLLELQIKLEKGHLLLPWREMGSLQNEQGVPEDVLFRVDTLPTLAGNAILPPIPSLEDPYPWLCQDWCIYLSANSPWPEEAACLMACLFSPEITTQRFDSRQWLKDPSLYETERPENEPPLPKSTAAYDELWEHLTRMKDTCILAKLPFMDWVELLESMYEGQISPETFAHTMQERIEMQLGE